MARCKPYFDEGALMVEQPFQERIGDGMIRVYLTHDNVVGFAHQYPAGLRSESAASRRRERSSSWRQRSGYEHLRNLMESSWVPELQQLLGIETAALPVIWDADFLYGPPTASGKDTYLLCEINASSTFAFPEHAMSTVAEAALRQLAARAERRAGTGSETRQKQTRH